MCKYLFQEGRCANPEIVGAQCMGEQNCDFLSKTDEEEENECNFDSWYGLYCPKYKRFFCPGREGCRTHEEYARNFEEHCRIERNLEI